MSTPRPTPTPRERLADRDESPSPALLTDPAEPPYPLTTDLIRQRLTDSLTANWPRMAHADHAKDVADSLMDVVLSIVSQLQDKSSSLRSKAVQALTQRDRARATAVTLEQMTAEAARLLPAGLPGQALAVLESDGRPLGPGAAADLFADMAPRDRPVDHTGAHSVDPRYVDRPDEGVWLPERMYVVVTVRRCVGDDFPVLDLHGAYPLVEDANGRALDLALKLSSADPTEVTSRSNGSVSLAVPPNGSFTGRIDVVELEVDPDYGRNLDNEG